MMLEQINDLPKGTVGIKASGKVDKEDYEKAARIRDVLNKRN